MLTEDEDVLDVFSMAQLLKWYLKHVTIDFVAFLSVSFLSKDT